MSSRTRQLRKVYRVGVERMHALRGIDLEIEANEFFAIMGSSGSGKSTLMNIIGCLDRPTAGTYELDGRDTSRISVNELALARNQRVGFVFQSFDLLPRMSALHTVELPRIHAKGPGRDSRRNAQAALDPVGRGHSRPPRPRPSSGVHTHRPALADRKLHRPGQHHHAATPLDLLGQLRLRLPHRHPRTAWVTPVVRRATNKSVLELGTPLGVHTPVPLPQRPGTLVKPLGGDRHTRDRCQHHRHTYQAPQTHAYLRRESVSVSINACGLTRPAEPQPAAL